MVNIGEMALFAAYADNACETEIVENNAETAAESWLTNSSFKIDVTPFQDDELLHPKHLQQATKSSESGDDLEEPLDLPKRKRKKSKKSKKAHKHTKRSRSKEKDGDADPENYSIDKTRVTEYKYANTIARPSAPRYHIHKYVGLERSRKAKKFKRYYQVILDKHINSSASEDEVNQTANKPKQESSSSDKGFEFIEEQDISRQTANFNRELQVDPCNIQMWIDYVNFQDSIFNFEKSFRKGSIAKGLRVTAERKLAILDKALQHSPDCEKLLRMRLEIAVSVYPADELQAQLKRLVDRDSGNIILWQGYIEATQCSMSHCTAPAVINLYIKCLHTLHTIRRTAKLHRALLEESILRMLYQCGLFLRQAGLFEQLWTLLRMYLELNLSSEDVNFDAALNATPDGDEKQLVELEDAVLRSQLPIHELWLRIEKLREASHWLPVASERGCEDPQRLVFTEDVSELIHPITMPGNTFRLAVTVMTLLKFPLLPCRHVSMQEFGVDYVPWSLDSIETLLPVFYPLYPLDVGSELLPNVQKLAVGPQYLKTLPGQEEYLRFVLNVVKSCAQCLSGRDKLAIVVWRLRFLRLLAVLEKRDMFKITSSLKKTLRSETKSVLRENSTRVVLFKEYALIESESSFDAGIKVLKTALTMSSGGGIHEKSEEERVEIVAALRTLIELHLFRHERMENDVKQECLKCICSIICGKFAVDDAPRFITQAIVDETKEKFVEINQKLFDNAENERIEGADHFLPDYATEMLILNAYFLLLNDFGEARIFVENLLERSEAAHAETKEEPSEESSAAGKVTAATFRKELLYEFLIAILFKMCVHVPGSGMFPTLDKYLRLGIEKYPNNLFMLATLAKVQSFHSNYGQPWWRTQKLLLRSGHALSTLFCVLIANQRVTDIESNWLDTVTGRQLATSGSFRNRILNLYKRVTRSDVCTRRCGLVWRLYLQFLHAHFEPKACRDAYYLAVEECPWLKALYIDAAIYIPEDLAQIQDLIIEKQLRIHVTPEELDVLRS